MPKKLTKEKANVILSNTPQDKIFWLNNGDTINNLEQLKQRLAEMNTETFMYHANPEKNDFANWIEHVLEDKKLANDIRRCKTPKTAGKQISQRISFLSKKIK